MSKPFTSIEDQIEILINRNMVFDDFERAKSFLMYNNYYNVVNCFSRFFIEDIKTGKFKEGTNLGCIYFSPFIIMLIALNGFDH